MTDTGSSPLIYGCMGLGGGWEQTSLTPAHLAQAHAAVDAALEAGIRVFDHADIYARGRAEEVFGQVLAERPELRDGITVQTKCGIRLADDELPGLYDSSEKTILARVDDSLRRLRTDRIDTLLIHRPDPLAAPEEIAAAYLRLKEAGKVLRLGVSNMSADQMQRLQGFLPDPLAANQLEMSLHHSGFAQSAVLVNLPEAAASGFPLGTLEYCQAHGAELQAWGPLSKGRYSGRLPAGASAADTATAELVAGLADTYGCTREAVVLGWLLRHPAGIRPVIGSSNPERIAACAGAPAAAAAMTRDDWYRLWLTAWGRAVP